MNPAGCEFVPEEFRKSCYSESGYIYFFEDKTQAIHFACGATFKVGLGSMGEVFEIDSRDVPVEKDPLLPSGSWRHKGLIKPYKLKNEIINCEEIGQGMKYWEKEFKNW